MKRNGRETISEGHINSAPLYVWSLIESENLHEFLLKSLSISCRIIEYFLLIFFWDFKISFCHNFTSLWSHFDDHSSSALSIRQKQRDFTADEVWDYFWRCLSPRKIFKVHKKLFNSHLKIAKTTQLKRLYATELYENKWESKCQRNQLCESKAESVNDDVEPRCERDGEENEKPVGNFRFRVSRASRSRLRRKQSKQTGKKRHWEVDRDVFNKDSAELIAIVMEISAEKFNFTQVDESNNRTKSKCGKLCLSRVELRRFLDSLMEIFSRVFMFHLQFYVDLKVKKKIWN